MRIARLPSLHATTLHTLYAAHSALYLAPSTIYTLLLARNSLESTLQTRRSTPHTLLTPQSLHELHAALCSPRSRRDPLNSTLHTENFKLYTADSTPHTIYTHTSHSILYTPHTQPSANTLYTPNFRFLTFHKTHSTHLALPNLYVTHNTADSTFHNLRAPPSTTRRDALHPALHILHSAFKLALQTPPSALHILYFTQHPTLRPTTKHPPISTHYTLETILSTVDNPHSTLQTFYAWSCNLPHSLDTLHLARHTLQSRRDLQKSTSTL